MKGLLKIITLLVLAGCSSDAIPGHEDADPPAQFPPQDPPPGGNVTTSSAIPSSMTPPVGVTWHVGITENVTRAQMQALYAAFVTANASIWQISEGQARVDTIRFFDNVAPGVTPQQFLGGGGGVNTSNLDILVWPRSRWNIPASGAVSTQGGLGRNNRIMIIPDNARTFVIVHEAGHFLFRLSWSVGSLLVDEYTDGVQDPACVMESERLPQRWCDETNHVNQQPQPHSCWRQILADYPLLRHIGIDSTVEPVAAPKAEYNDTP